MSGRKISCGVSLVDDCKSHNGANTNINITLQAHLSCLNSSVTLSKSASLTSSQSYVSLTFDEPLAGEEYSVTAFVQNEAGSGPPVYSSISTSSQSK